jgi:hypothetical protein
MSMVTTLNLAMQDSRPLRFAWDWVPEAFEVPSLLQQQQREKMDWSKPFSSLPWSPACSFQPYLCAPAMNCMYRRWYSSSAEWVYAPSRLCFKDATCEYLQTTHGTDLSLATILGCPLRLMLEPRASFLRDNKIMFREGESNLRSMSLREIELNVFAKYHVVGLQIRLGDFTFDKFNETEIVMLTNKRLARLWQTPVKCALTVQSHLESPHSGTVKRVGPFLAKQQPQPPRGTRKPVRFFVMSDSKPISDAVLSLLGDLVLRVDLPPAHVEFAQDRSMAMRNTLMEWYLLSLCDDLVASTTVLVPAEHINQYRVSALATTAWVFGLKHLFYDGSTCELKTLPTVEPLSNLDQVPLACTARIQNISQPHMDFVADNEAAAAVFPDVWNQHGTTYFSACSVDSPESCLVSVVIKYRCRELEGLRKLVRNLSKQTHDHWELVLVHDESFPKCKPPGPQGWWWLKTTAFRRVFMVKSASLCASCPAAHLFKVQPCWCKPFAGVDFALGDFVVRVHPGDKEMKPDRFAKQVNELLVTNTTINWYVEEGSRGAQVDSLNKTMLLKAAMFNSQRIQVGKLAFEHYVDSDELLWHRLVSLSSHSTSRTLGSAVLS